MPICPRGHESQAEDWCDFCGFPMTPPPGVSVPGAGTFGGSPTPPPPPSYQPAPPPGPPQAPPAGMYQQATAGLVTCPICRTPQTGRYCEECGYDFDLSAPSQRQAPPSGGYGYPPPAPFPQSPPPPPPAQPGHPAQPMHGAPPAHGAQPTQQAGYGYPPPPAFPQTVGFPEPEGPEHTGPVYAQPDPGRSPDQSPTSFRLAPPSAAPQPPQTPAAPPAQPPARTTWIAVVSADRDYFTDMMARSGPEAAGLFFPPYCPERRIPLTGRGQLRIGRRSQHRGTVPEIDLSVPPEDPGASHQHAMLAEQADGSWVLVDQDSTNGTTVNGSPDPVPPHTAVPLQDGDRIHIGAWTTITLHRS
ncbi:FHA domain-containing protein [Kitasatospora sp. NPDC002227]|uniref:FHA domain-containing protein n=1 Tax=Kitasatospora sp. NPDC002227 TaxID=3154773 RepID=UPI00332F0017